MSKGLRVVVYVSIVYFLFISFLFIPSIIKLIIDSPPIVVVRPRDLVILYIRSLNPITLFWLLYISIYLLNRYIKRKNS